VKRPRRTDTRSMRAKDVQSIVQIKPQLSPVKGPFTRIRFFALRTSRPGGGVETVGDLVLRDGRIVADPPDSISLRNVLADEVWVHGRGEDPPLKLNATDHPKEFFEHLPKEFGHGTYFWAEPVED
jgi:hypothetical protein